MPTYVEGYRDSITGRWKWVEIYEEPDPGMIEFLEKSRNAPPYRREFHPYEPVSLELEISGSTFRIYEDPEEECMVVETPQGNCTLREFKNITGSIECSECHVSFHSIEQALEHCASTKHSRFYAI